MAFVSSEEKVARKTTISMPRLVLCAALEAPRAAYTGITTELELKPSALHFYSDCKVALGYIFNETAPSLNMLRGESMRRRGMPPSHGGITFNTLENSADIATRPTCLDTLFNSQWIKGPTFLWKPNFVPEPYVNYTNARSNH